jgi:hypothetical protein
LEINSFSSFYTLNDLALRGRGIVKHSIRIGCHISESMLLGFLQPWTPNPPLHSLKQFYDHSKFAQFDEAEESLDEDITETSEIKLESAHSIPENPEVPRVVVGIYDLAEDSPVEPLIYPNAVAEDVTPTEHP